MSITGEPTRVLILDDVPSDAALVERELRHGGLDLITRCVETEPEFVAALADFRPDLVLSDYSLPSFNGMDALRLVQQHSPTTPLIIVTGSLTEETAAECIKAGAADYVLKERLARLLPAVRGALERQRLKEDQRRVEEALLESENQLRAMFELASVGIAQADPRTGRWLRVNQKMCAITGYTAEELIGLQLLDITHPDDRQEDWEALQRVVRGEAADYRLEKRYVRKDGSVTWVNVNMTVIRDEGGRPFQTIAIVEDIAGRKRAEETLRASEERYRLLAENTSDVIWTMDLSGHLTYVSPSIASLCGFSVEEMIGRSFAEWLAPASATSVRQDIAEAMATERKGERAEGRRFEVEAVCKGGSTVWCEVSAAGLYSPAGKLIGTVGVTRDISKRRHVEEALRDSEAGFRLLFLDNPLPMWVYDLETLAFLEVNGPAVANYGWSREQFLRMKITDIRPPEDVPRLLRDVAGPRDAFTPSGEWRHRLRGGRIINVTITSHKLDFAGRRAALVVATDITERKRAEEALRESEERYRLIAENTADVIWTLDLATRRFTYVSPSIERLRGFTPEEVLAQPFEASLTPDSLARVEGHLATTLAALAAGDQSGRTRTMEVDQPTKKGGTVRTEVVASALTDASGRVTGVLGVTRDVTERRKLEEQLRQSQKMEAVGQLAGGVAHDFNNLLQAMLSLTQMHGEHLADPERLKADAAELENLVRRGAALTRQLLLFSRREPVRLERLDLNEVVRDGVTMLRRLLKAHVAIEVSFAEGQLPVDADRGQIGQVLMNLAVNAGDAMRDGGRLTIETGSEGPTVWLKVTDTGGGIPAAIRDHVFDPFFTTKGEGKGTGLGLSVVHGIVTRHGGTVTLECQEGQGTTFTVVLPRAGSGEHQAAEIAERGGAPQRGHGELVLVVEDEESARQALAEILTMLGYRVTAVGSGEEAGRLAAEEPFDLLLTDLMLPGISGSDLAAGLQARWPDLRVVLMSGYAEDEAVRVASGTGVVRFLQKPFDMDTLSRELRAALETA